MDEKERKRLEAAERKRQRERERYQKARRSGFSPKEAKSIKKTIAERPELIQDIESISKSVAGEIENLTDLIGSLFTDSPTKKKRKPSVKFKEKKKPLTDHQRRLNKEAGAFKRFLRRNPTLSQREALAKFRQMGHTMGSQRGADIYREYLGKGKDERKRTRFPTYALDQNPSGAFYFKARYMYVMGYSVLVSGTGEWEERFMTIASDKRLNKQQRAQEVLDAYDEGELDQNEYYAAIYIDEDTIHTVYMVDTHKKSKKFMAFEQRMKSENPDMSISAIYRAYKASLK